MKFKDFIESNPAVKERSNLSVNCVKTLIGTIYEEGIDLIILRNDGEQILISSFVDCWAVLDDNYLVYSGELFEADDNRITVVDFSGDTIRYIHGTVDSAGNLVYIEGRSIIKRNGAGIKTKFADVLEGKAYSVRYENGIVVVVQNYGDTGIIRSVYYDENGNIMKKETADDLLGSIQYRIYYGLMLMYKLNEADDAQKICVAKHITDMDMIRGEGSVTCRYVEKVIRDLKSANMLNGYQERLFRKFKKTVFSYKLENEFHNIILNVIDMGEKGVFSPREKNSLFSPKILDLMEKCRKLYSTADIREAFPDRIKFEEMLKNADKKRSVSDNQHTNGL